MISFMSRVLQKWMNALRTLVKMADHASMKSTGFNGDSMEVTVKQVCVSFFEIAVNCH